MLPFKKLGIGKDNFFNILYNLILKNILKEKDFKTKINGENNHERKDMRYRFLYTGALLRQQ